MSESPFSYSRDVAPLKGLHFNPADDSSIESYARQFAPLIEAKKKYKEERLQRRQQKLNFELSKQTLKARQQESKESIDLLAKSPGLANGLSQITEDFKDDPEGGQRALVRFMSDNSLALSKNPALNRQVGLQNSFFERKISEKKDEEKRIEKLNLERALTYFELGDKEKSDEHFGQLTSPESIETFRLGVKLQQKAAAKDADAISDDKEDAVEKERDRFKAFVDDTKTAIGKIAPEDPTGLYLPPGKEEPIPDTLYERIERSEGAFQINFAAKRAMDLFPDELKEYQGRDIREILKSPDGKTFLQKVFNTLNVAVDSGSTGTPADRQNPLDAGE